MTTTKPATSTTVANAAATAAGDTAAPGDELIESFGASGLIGAGFATAATEPSPAPQLTPVPQSAEVDRESIAASVIELCDRVLAASDLDRDLAVGVSELGASLVIVATSDGDDRNRIAAAHPPHSVVDDATLLAACDEAELLGRPIVWPPKTRLDRPARRAVQTAAIALGVDRLLLWPLIDDDDSVVRVVLAAAPTSQLLQVVPGACPTVSLAVAAKDAAARSVVARCRESVRGALGGRPARVAAAAVLAMLAVLVCPWPYSAKCDCTIEPDYRRFVAAPFDGRLDRVDVHPGDVVTAGQPLAVMDNHDLEFELAGLRAERQQADREQTIALAKRDRTAAAIAKLEQARLDARIALLEGRRERLQVTSPIDGIIVDGDLDRVRGMPLERGHSLFEVAPLDRVLVEVRVPQYDYAQIRVGQTVRMHFDADPWTGLDAVVQRLRPRAADGETEPVFIAEVELDNPAGTLRPGMTGDAAIRTNWHSLGWNWLHRWYGEFRRGF